jgi:hypothetical protein
MIPAEIARQLEDIALKPDFMLNSEQLIIQWSLANIGIEAIESILYFMEKYPTTEFGAPGPLVHFVERYNGPEYERLLAESVQRKPTTHTVWMLSRLINGAQSADVKRRLIATMEAAKLNPLTSQEVLQELTRFLNRR